MANYIKGIGDALTGKNEIFPSFDAKIFAYITQNSAGVCGTEASKFPITTVDRGVQIGAGMVQAFGYFGMSDSPIQLNFVYPTGSAQYARVYAEVNLSVTPHEFNIKASPQSTTSNIQLIQDDLNITPSGIHQIPLFLLTINPNNTITATDQRVVLNSPYLAMYANNVIDNIAGRAISAIFESGTDVKKATLATTATTATKATTVEFTTSAPTSSPAAGTLRIYTGSSTPSTRYDRVLYLITV